MNPLISKHVREIGGVLQQAVDARDLWAFFKPYSPFAGWMRNKLIQYEFVENRDYVRVKVMREIHYAFKSRVSHQVDYWLTEKTAETIGADEFCRGPNSWK